MQKVYHCYLVQDVEFDWEGDILPSKGEMNAAKDSVIGKCFDLDVTTEPEMVGEILADKISNASGWCVLAFNYRCVAVHNGEIHG